MSATPREDAVVVAPGKVFLVGEYAVLEGGTAVLAAVNRQAAGHFVPALEPESPLVAEAVRVTLAALGDKAAALPAGSVWVDTRAFAERGGAAGEGHVQLQGQVQRQGQGQGQAMGRKLGLGSSAATAACSVGAMLELAGMPVATHRELAFSLAESAHRAWQGGVGSGADVAIAIHGGIVQYSRPVGGAPVVHRPPHGLAGLELVVFSARTASSTTHQIGAVRAFAARSPAHYASLLAAVRKAAERFVDALAAARARDAIAAIRAAGESLSALGEAAEVAIVTAPFLRAAAIAAELGGAAKPSGAGGGDVGVALFTDRASAHAFTQRVGHGPHDADDTQVDVLDLRIDDHGLHRRSAGITRVEQHV